MTIRLHQLTHPTAEDHAQLSTLILQLTPHARHLSLSDLREVACSHTLIVARDEASDNRIVGTALLAVMRTVSHVNGQIEDVVVDDGRRHLGIARAMMKALITAARAAGVERIDLGSEPHRAAANALYRSLGFAVRDTNLYRLTL